LFSEHEIKLQENGNLKFDIMLGCVGKGILYVVPILINNPGSIYTFSFTGFHI
jgi:hypothetical protein